MNAVAGYGISFNVSMSTINSLITVFQDDPTNTGTITALKKQFAGLVEAYI